MGGKVRVATQRADRLREQEDRVQQCGTFGNDSKLSADQMERCRLAVRQTDFCRGRWSGQLQVEDENVEIAFVCPGEAAEITPRQLALAPAYTGPANQERDPELMLPRLAIKSASAFDMTQNATTLFIAKTFHLQRLHQVAPLAFGL